MEPYFDLLTEIRPPGSPIGMGTVPASPTTSIPLVRLIPTHSLEVHEGPHDLGSAGAGADPTSRMAGEQSEESGGGEGLVVSDGLALALGRSISCDSSISQSTTTSSTGRLRGTKFLTRATTASGNGYASGNGNGNGLHERPVGRSQHAIGGQA